MQYQHHQNGPIPLHCYIDGCDGAIMEKPTRWHVWIIERSHHEFNEEDCAERQGQPSMKSWKCDDKKTKAACITLVIPFYQRFSDFAGMLKLLKRSTRFWCYDDATFSGSRHHLWGVKIVIALVALQLHNGSKSHLSCQLCGSALWAQWVGNYWGIWRWDELFFGLVIKCAVQRMSLYKHTLKYTKKDILEDVCQFLMKENLLMHSCFEAREIQYFLQYFFDRESTSHGSKSLKIVLEDLIP